MDSHVFLWIPIGFVWIPEDSCRIPVDSLTIEVYVKITICFSFGNVSPRDHFFGINKLGTTIVLPVQVSLRRVPSYRSWQPYLYGKMYGR